jgi:hypothetical protein
LVCTKLRLLDFFPGFWIMMIFACFKEAGQYCSLRIALKCTEEFDILRGAFPVAFGL